MKEKAKIILFVVCGLRLMTWISWIELGQDRSWNSLEHLFREDTQQLPSDVQRLEYGTVLVVTLLDKIELKFPLSRVNQS